METPSKPLVFHRSSPKCSLLQRVFCLAVALYTLWIPVALWAQQDGASGLPWNGEKGVTESIRDITDRQNVADRLASPESLRTDRRGQTDRTKLKDNPNAPKVSKWPPDSFSSLEDEVVAINEVKTDTQPQLPQTAGVSFVGVTLSESGFIPPDSMGAVGPSQIVAIENGRIKTFNKSGVLDGAINVTTDTLFASVRNNSGTSDPQITYDRLSQRFFIVMINLSTPNRVMLAMSSGPAITSTSSFTFFQFQHDLVGPTPNADTGGFADQGRLGVDKNALYVGVNVFNASGSAFLGSTGFVVRKSGLIANTLTVTAFRQLGTASAAGPFAPQGVDNDDPNSTEGYFIGVDTLAFSLIQIRRVSNPGGTPSISGNLSLTVPATTSPRSVPVKGSTFPLDGSDERLVSAQLKNGSLWTAHQIQVNSSGVASSTGGRDGVRWYQITNLTGAPILNQSGTLFDSAATNPVYYFYGGIAMSGQGHAALASTFASTQSFAGVAATGRLATDPPGTLNSTIVTIAAGAGAYNVQSVNPQRWGDYSKTVVDPNDDMTMWTFQERANATNSWGVQVTQLKAPPPATPSSASPNSAIAGAMLNVIVTGTSSSGSGFFDPGSAFPNHISATVNGGGVTVNSVTYTNPTTATLNITIASGATPGSRTVTVTNPDAQAATSATGIFTIVAPTITLSPSTLPNGIVGTSYNQSITASGGTGPYTFSVISGNLPGGVLLNASTGVVSGTPTTGGTANVTIQATDSGSNAGSQAYTVKISSVISSNVSLPVISTSYDPTPSPGFAGSFSINTTLTNNGPSVNSPLFFKITQLIKNGTDQNPAQPNKLRSADNGAGVVGDFQTLGISSLATNASTPVTFLVGIGSRQSFNFFVDLYGVQPGTAKISLDSKILKATTNMTLLGHFQFEISETNIPPGSGGPILDFTVTTPITNVGVITGPGPQSRPAVAVDPSFPGRIAVASNDYEAGTVRVSTTQDGGTTWHGTTLSRSLGNRQFYTALNPSLAFDSLGHLSIVYSLSDLDDSANAIVITESSDGIDFPPPTAISFHLSSDQVIDSRPVIAIQPGVGRYVAWDSFSIAAQRYSINLANSVERGLFGAPLAVVSNGLVSSPALAVSRSGLYVGWDDWGFNSSPPYNTGGRLMITSTAIGAEFAFDEPQEIARTSIGFSQKILAMPEKGASPNLSLAVDPKKEDTVHAVFADRGNGIDIFSTRSPNGGKTWQQAKVVNDDSGLADQFNPAIGVDSDGNVGVIFYDTRLSSTFEAADVFMSNSSNGNRFEDNVRISDVSSNDSRKNLSRDYTANLGDRIGFAVATNGVVIVWTDTRHGNEDIVLSIVGVNPGDDQGGGNMTGSTPTR